MMASRMPLRTATLLDPEEAYGLVRAALDGSVVLVPLDRAPAELGKHVLQLRAPGLETPLLVVAEPVGEPTAGMFPLRLRPKDATHAAQLAALIDVEPPSDPTVPDLTPPGRTRDRASFRVMDDMPLVGGTRVSQTLDSLDAPLGNVVNLGRVGTLDTPLNLDSQELAGSDAAVQAAREQARGQQDDLGGRSLAGGKYKILDEIGRGGAGKVYRARHVALDKEIAVKVLHRGREADERTVRRFSREAQTLSRLDHPNVIRVLDFGREPDGRLFIAMELLEGTPLNRIIAKRAPLALKRTVGLMVQICAGLGAAHAEGIIHRDVKPENVIIVPKTDEDGGTALTIKVCDFGTARMMEPGSPVSEVTGTGILCGTPEFMAPEQILSEPADAATDIYSCGVILYEMATGRLPFQSQSVVAILNSHLYDPPPKPTRIQPAVDPGLERVILKAMSKDRRKRHQSARELRDELAALAQR